jgi:hypothetical protein
MSLQAYDPPAPRRWVALLPSSAELAKAVAHTEFVPAGLRGNPAAITACILYGDEIGLGPMQALAHIAVIDGRPSLAAEAMRGLALGAGHDVWVEEATNTRATVAGRRRDSDQSSRVTWTMDDAKRAGLSGKRNWRTYPRQMLIARASAELCRAIFADAIGGLVATEELDDEAATGTAEGGDVVEQGGTRRRRRALAPVSSPPTPGHADPEPAAARPPLPGEEASEPGPSDSTAGVGLGEQAPAPSDADSPKLMTDPQRQKMMALFRELGFTEREGRLAFTRFVIGHAIESSTELTRDEARAVIDALETRAANEPPPPADE